jgi:uroporphyrinogen decarboxylase
MTLPDTVTSKELVNAALKGTPVPRVPTGPLAVHFCARVAGCTLREYTTSPAALADSILRYYEHFKPDAVWLSADTWVSAEAMGAKVGASDPNQPFGGIGEPLVQTAADIDRLPDVDVNTQGRYPLMLDALRRVVREVGKDVFVVACFDQYPFSLAAALMGVNQIMLKVLDDAPFVQALMERCLPFALAYGRALSDAGADLLSGGDSPAGLLGPELYEQIALPFEKRLIAPLKTATGKPISLHICGNASALLRQMAASGADVIEFDHAVDPAIVCRVLDSRVALWGNLDPVRLLMQGQPGQVTAAARKLLEEIKANHRSNFVLSSGCTLAVETPHENLKALISAPSSFPDLLSYPQRQTPVLMPDQPVPCSNSPIQRQVP